VWLVALRAAGDTTRLGEPGHPELTIDGPTPCAIARIGGFHRIELVLTARRRSVIQEALGAVRGRGMLTSDAHTAVDVDPVAMM
jgi:primosomal protein N'